MSYKIDYTRIKDKMDEIVKEDGFDLVLEAKSLLMLAGTEVDFEENELHSAFVFRNPKATSQCGCGDSFNFN